MFPWKALALASTLVTAAAFAPAAPAQISVGINLGSAPVCPYGYYDYAPYNCSPYGYYGPDWFRGGVFIGAGPYYRGPAGFYGHVDNRYDPHHGYNGPFPDRGARPFNHFQGNEAHGPTGQIGNAGHEPTNEHQGGFSGRGGSPGGGHPR